MSKKLKRKHPSSPHSDDRPVLSQAQFQELAKTRINFAEDFSWIEIDGHRTLLDPARSVLVKRLFFQRLTGCREDLETKRLLFGNGFRLDAFRDAFRYGDGSYHPAYEVEGKQQGYISNGAHRGMKRFKFPWEGVPSARRIYSVEVPPAVPPPTETEGSESEDDGQHGGDGTAA